MARVIFLLTEKIFFRNQPIRNKNCLWQPCLLTDWDEMSNLYRRPSIDTSYQVSVHLAEGFQRRRLKCEKLTDDRRRMTDAKWWQKLTLPLARWAKNVQITEKWCYYDVPFYRVRVTDIYYSITDKTVSIGWSIC
jgi:hypothetical protein